MKQKLTALFLVLALVLGLTVPAWAGYYGWGDEDQVPAWAADAYQRLDNLGATMRTDSIPIERGSFIRILTMAAEKAIPGAKLAAFPETPADYFADLEVGDGYAAVYRRAVSYGITEGVLEGGEHHMKENNAITRQECAKLVCSALDILTKVGYDLPEESSTVVYADQDAIPSWAAPFTGRVAGYGLMVGDQSGNFLPADNMDWPSAMVLIDRTWTWMGKAMMTAGGASPVESKLDWGNMRVTTSDYQIARPTTGYPGCVYTVPGQDGGLTCVVFEEPRSVYDQASEEWVDVGGEAFHVERFDADGKLVWSKDIPRELSKLGAFLAGWDGNYYAAYGQDNPDNDDEMEVWRVVKYDAGWNRVDSCSATGGETYTAVPFQATVSRMDLSEDGQLCLYAARKRYDGHQSNITFFVDADAMTFDKILGDRFPDNHVSHSFGQFVRYDGDSIVTVDHGDAYPRSFSLHKGKDSFRVTTLLAIDGQTGQNVTHAIGSGLEVSESGYLFLGCSAPQEDYEAEQSAPWNLFLTYTDKSLGKTDLTWLTESETTINTARLVKADDNTFVVMWKDGDDIHAITVNGQGEKVSDETVLPDAVMPSTQPIFTEAGVEWFAKVTTGGTAQLVRYTLPVLQ